MPSTLPSFSRGLKLVRLAVFLMLLQLALTIVMAVRAIHAGSGEGIHMVIEWTKYLMLANLGATLAMLVGVVRALPELARARMSIRGLAIAAACFAVASAMLGWNYQVFSRFIAVALNPDSSVESMMQAAEAVDSARYVVIVKDLAYAWGLICVLGTVQRSAALNDQLSLRDEAGSMSRALIVMLVADLFWQLTYGLGGAIGTFGGLGSLLVGVYWIYCHVRLARFLYNAAYFVNEPHNLPIATVVVRDEPPAAPAPRATTRPAPPPVVVAAPVVATAPPPPRAESASEDGAEPRFLR